VTLASGQIFADAVYRILIFIKGCHQRKLGSNDLVFVAAFDGSTHPILGFSKARGNRVESWKTGLVFNGHIGVSLPYFDKPNF
jgi:hypothetical protein